MLTKMNSIRENHEEGFTLIELLVVILIIGILAAIAIPAFLNQRKSAVDSSVQSDVKNAATQVEGWITKQGSTAKPITTDAIGEMDLKTSEGVTLDIKGTSAEYCIVGIHENGDTSTGANGGIVYSSTSGGIVTGEGTCSSTGTFLPANGGGGSSAPIANAGTFGIGQEQAVTSSVLTEQVIQTTPDGNQYWDNGSNTVPFTVSFVNTSADTMDITVEFPSGVGSASGLTLSAVGMASETDRATYGNDKGYSNTTFTEIAPGTYSMTYSGGDLGNANELGLTFTASNGQPKNTAGSGFWQTPNPDYVGYTGSVTYYIGG